MKNEIWKPIPGGDGFYLCSNMGRLWRKERVVSRSDGQKQTVKEKIWSGCLSGGYYYAGISYNGVEIFRGHVHQLVAIIFLGHKPNGVKSVVDHINENKLDNRVENLRVLSHRKNTSRSRKGGTSIYQGVHWLSKRSVWVSKIMINGKNHHLGWFDNEIEAHKAYQKKLLEIEP